MANDYTIHQLREKIADTVLEVDEAQSFLLTRDEDKNVQSPEEWRYTMRQSGEWCNDVFVYLAATMLKKEIVLIPIYPNDGHDGTGKIVITPQEKLGDPIYMLYYKDVHFQSILPIGSSLPIVTNHSELR